MVDSICFQTLLVCLETKIGAVIRTSRPINLTGAGNIFKMNVNQVIWSGNKIQMFHIIKQRLNYAIIARILVVQFQNVDIDNLMRWMFSKILQGLRKVTMIIQIIQKVIFIIIMFIIIVIIVSEEMEIIFQYNFKVFQIIIPVIQEEINHKITIIFQIEMCIM